MNYSKLILFVTIVLASASSAFAQIGYQVSLLNNANGEPRANESVTVTVTITNSEGGVVCTETKTETTNDFGVLSMTVGSDAIFAATDWSKLPFFISATVDGVLIGRSQLLSVPVAECAKAITSCKDILMSKTWRGHFGGNYYGNSGSLSFGDKTLTQTIFYEGGSETSSYSYRVQGNIIIGGGEHTPYIYDPENNCIIGSYDTVLR